MRRCWLTAVLGLVIVAGVATPAHAAPAAGVWAGQKGDLRLRFTVEPRRGGLVLTDVVRACGWMVLEDVDHRPRADRIGSDGRPRGHRTKYGTTVKPVLAGRLGRTQGRLSSPISFSGSGPHGDVDCSSSEGKRMRVRRVAPSPHVRDGVWTVHSDQLVTEFGPGSPTDATFFVKWNGAVIYHRSGEWGGSYQGQWLGQPWYCDTGLADPWMIGLDGRWDMPWSGSYGDLGVNARFDSPTTLSGTYRPTKQPTFECDGGEHPFTAQLTKAADAKPVAAPQPAPDPEPVGPAGGPQPSGQPGCLPEVKLGAVRLRGVCLKREGRIVTVEGAARVNGIDLVPLGDAKLVADLGQLKITAKGRVEVRLGDLTLWEGPFEWDARKTFSFKAGGPQKQRKIKGLPVTGSIEGSWVPDGATLKVHVGLGPDFGSITGDATLKATMADGLKLDALAVDLSDSDLKLLGRLTLRSAGISYDAPSDTWAGAAEVGLPAGPAVGGSLAIQGGRFKSASGRADDLNAPLGQVLFLQRIGFGVAVRPLKLSGEMGFTAGPKLRIFGYRLSALEGNGSFSWLDGSPSDTWTIGGNLKLASFTLGDASVVYRTGLDATFQGHLVFKILEAGFDGNANGWVAGRRAFQGDADGTISLPLLSASGRAIVSNRGVAACGKKDILFGTVGGGVTWRWGRSPQLFAGGCDFGDIEVRKGARAAQAPPAITVRGRPKALLLAIRGSDGAPDVTVTGPGGFSIAPGPEGATLTDRAYLVQSAEARTTYVVLGAPERGRYEIGGAPAASVGTARLLPTPRVRASVTALRGGRRLLRWKIPRAAGQTVQFVERGRGIARPLLVARPGSGRRVFRPHPGPAGRRRIVAVLRYRGLPRRTVRVAAFRAAATRAGRPVRVRIARAKRRVEVRWRATGPALGYDVRLHLRDGRRLLRVAGPRARRVAFAHVGRRARGTVRITARGFGRQSSQRAVRRLR